MEINDTVIESVKYMWNGIVVVLSGLLSFGLWKAKKKSQEFEIMKSVQNKHDVMLAVTTERLENLDELLKELKQDIKEILFNICKLRPKK